MPHLFNHGSLFLVAFTAEGLKPRLKARHGGLHRFTWLPAGNAPIGSQLTRSTGQSEPCRYPLRLAAGGIGKRCFLELLPGIEERFPQRFPVFQHLFDKSREGRAIVFINCRIQRFGEFVPVVEVVQILEAAQTLPGIGGNVRHAQYSTGGRFLVPSDGSRRQAWESP